MISITACIIVKNEETVLARCLDSLQYIVEEIIIVDTGSEDGTKEIARGYTDKIYDFNWTNDFAAARNFSISKATNEFILVLDADEYIENVNRSIMEQLIISNRNKAGRILITSTYSRRGTTYRSSERLTRLFSKEYFKYEGVIHEQIVPARQGLKVETYNVPLTVIHTGYDGGLEERKIKTKRNIMLLKEELENKPEDPYVLYQLGKSYYMQEDYTMACQYFGQALYLDLDTKLEYVQDLVESYGYSLINTEQYDMAMQLLNIYEEFSQSADFVFLIGLILMNHGEFEEAVEEFIKATGFLECKMEGVNNYLAYYNIGVIYECLGDIENARKYYLKCGGYEMAKDRVSRLN
jgi:glycosyltransferase involved in cell wall biosynthesis